MRTFWYAVAAPWTCTQSLISKPVHTLTEQLTYLKCAHAYTDPSYQSDYRAPNITHAKQRVAPALCDLSLITQGQIPMPLSVIVTFPKKKKKA